jgi:hypothetical protein
VCTVEVGWVAPGEADWGGHFRSRDIATLVAIHRKCIGHILKLSDTRRRPLAVSERTSKSNLYDNNTRKYQDNGHLSMTRSLCHYDRYDNMSQIKKVLLSSKNNVVYSKLLSDIN